MSGADNMAKAAADLAAVSGVSYAEAFRAVEAAMVRDKLGESPENTALDALTEALLMEYGLQVGTVHMDLQEAFNLVRPRAQSVLHELQEMGFDVTKVSRERKVKR